MREALPEFFEPLLYAAQGRRLSGRLALGRMERLREMTVALDGEAAVELAFASDPHGRCAITGEIAVEVRLLCQRCLEPYPLQVAVEVALVVVSPTDGEPELEAGFEPLAESGRVALRDMVEDEIILALPLVARHPERDCNRALGTLEQTAEQRENPFSVLENWNDTQDGETP